MLGWTEQRRGWAARAIVLRRGCCALPRRHVSACLRGGEGLQAATRREKLVLGSWVGVLLTFLIPNRVLYGVTQRSEY